MLERKAGFNRAFGINIKKFSSNVPNLFCCFSARFLPRFTAEFVQRRRFFRTAGVAGEQMKRGDRDIKLGPFLIFQGDKFCCQAAGFEGLQPFISSDAVLEVDNRLTGLELCQSPDDGFTADGGFFIIATATLRNAFAEEVGFTNEAKPASSRINPFSAGPIINVTRLGASSASYTE